MFQTERFYNHKLVTAQLTYKLINKIGITYDLWYLLTVYTFQTYCPQTTALSYNTFNFRSRQGDLKYNYLLILIDFWNQSIKVIDLYLACNIMLRVAIGYQTTLLCSLYGHIVRLSFLWYNAFIIVWTYMYTLSATSYTPKANIYWDKRKQISDWIKNNYSCFLLNIFHL